MNFSWAIVHCARQLAPAPWYWKRFCSNRHGQKLSGSPLVLVLLPPSDTTVPTGFRVHVFAETIWESLSDLELNRSCFNQVRHLCARVYLEIDALFERRHATIQGCHERGTRNEGAPPCESAGKLEQITWSFARSSKTTRNSCKPSHANSLPKAHSHL